MSRWAQGTSLTKRCRKWAAVIGAALRETPGAPLIVLRALGSVLWNLPYCLRNRQPVTAEDFELPLD